MLKPFHALVGAHWLNDWFQGEKPWKPLKLLNEGVFQFQGVFDHWLCDDHGVEFHAAFDQLLKPVNPENGVLKPWFHDGLPWNPWKFWKPGNALKPLNANGVLNMCGPLFVGVLIRRSRLRSVCFRSALRRGEFGGTRIGEFNSGLWEGPARYLRVVRGCRRESVARVGREAVGGFGDGYRVDLCVRREGFI